MNGLFPLWRLHLAPRSNQTTNWSLREVMSASGPFPGNRALPPKPAIGAEANRGDGPIGVTNGSVPLEDRGADSRLTTGALSSPTHLSGARCRRAPRTAIAI